MSTPRVHRGARYRFQFQGSVEAPWKQRRKLSSTMAEPASCSRGEMSRIVCLHQRLMVSTFT